MARVWLLIALLTVAPVAVAQVQARLEFDALRFSGSAEVAVHMQGATWINATDALAGLRLNITDGTMEIDETRIDVVVRGAGLTPANSTKSVTPIQDGTVAGFIAGNVTRFILVGNQQGTINMGAGSLARNPASRMEFVAFASNRKDLVIDSPSGLSLEGTGVARIQAPFLLSVWEANFTLTQQGQERQVRTGAYFDPLIEDVPPSTAYRATLAEAVFRVTAGHVDLPLDEAAVIYAQTLAMSLPQGVASMGGAHGRLPVGEILLEGNNVEVDGPFSAQLEASQNRVLLSWDAPPEVIRVDGQQVIPKGTSPWLWAVGAMLLVSVPLVASSVARWRLRKHLQTLDGYVITRQFQAALALARRLRRRRPHLQDPLVAEAVSLLNERHYAQAMVVLSEPHWKPESEPTRAYLQAAALAGIGHEQEAVQRLRQCLAIAPGMAREASLHPLLGGLLGRAKAGNPV